MTLKIAFIADPHLAQVANRINTWTLWKRGFWQHIDAAPRDENKTLFKPASHEVRPLNAAVEFIRSASHQLDMLVLLGDLATTGLPEDIDVAKKVFTDTSGKRHIDSSIGPRFGVLGIPLHIIPGNHDRYQNDLGKPGGKLFDREFASVYKPVNSVSHHHLQSDDVTLGLFSADFCYLADELVLGLKKRYGRGRASSIVLGELDRQTSLWKKQNPGKPVIWAIHFSPSDNVDKEILLENRSDVIALANTLGVKHIFCGHTHLRSHDIGSHPHLYTAGSVSAVESRHDHFLHVCQVAKDGRHSNLQVKDYGYDEKTDEFVLKPASLRA